MNCPHCGVHVDEHSGLLRCFDAWVLEVVFDKPRWTNAKEMAEKHGITNCPPYGYDIAAAWEVVEKMGGMTIYPLYLESEEPGWKAATHPESGRVKYHFGQAITAPLAICRAAIKAQNG